MIAQCTHTRTQHHSIAWHSEYIVNLLLCWLSSTLDHFQLHKDSWQTQFIRHTLQIQLLYTFSMGKMVSFDDGDGGSVVAVTGMAWTKRVKYGEYNVKEFKNIWIVAKACANYICDEVLMQKYGDLGWNTKCTIVWCVRVYEYILKLPMCECYLNELHFLFSCFRYIENCIYVCVGVWSMIYTLYV